MVNPFTKNNYTLPLASINHVKLIILKDELSKLGIYNKSAYQVFSSKEIINELKLYTSQLNLSNYKDHELLILANKILSENNLEKIALIKKISKKYGEVLGYIFHSLKNDTFKNRQTRFDWHDRHWSFWKTINKIFISGGILNGNFGNLLLKSTKKLLLDNKIVDLKIFKATDTQEIGLLGSSLFIKENSPYNMVFDFGQTFIKRGIANFENNILQYVDILPKKKSLYTNCENFSDLDSKLLNEYIINTILDTYKNATYPKESLGNEISISFANNILDKKLSNSGGYAKLNLIANNYENYLSNKVSQILNYKFKINLIHDGTAIAANFHNNKTINSVSISSGTAFSIGFPNEVKIYKKSKTNSKNFVKIT
ncbi:MAG: hypothetical protein ABF289_10620 [Clostridiales bacterium]